ncbi:MAG: SusE domain-containing protein [Candidatus Symbiothrix sp.]|jgi:hypothetical protein|nr:SusE domain-containing protein [Candidatus Symbiothrix sp.]
MKNKLLLLAVAVYCTSCYNYDWDAEHKTSLTAFSISTPDLQTAITVNYADSTTNFGSETRLEWEKSKSADFSKVFYEVCFYNSENLETSFFKQITGFGQIDNFLVLTEKDLNIIAEKAGIAQNSTGDVYWQVRASNGINEVFSDNRKKLSISRPAGFAYYPEKILTAGGAVGNGKELEMKRIQQKVGNEYIYTGEYELFLYLSDGNFYLTEKDSDRRFYLSADGGLKELFGEEKQSLANASITAGKIHRVKINLKNVTAVFVAVEAIDVWYSGENDILGTLQQSNAQVPYWTLTQHVELAGSGAAIDYRYKFRITQKDMAGEQSSSFWGYSAIIAPNQSANSQASYFYLYEVDNSQSDYCYKFNRTDHNQHTLKIDVDFRPEIEQFTHKVTVVE